MAVGAEAAGFEVTTAAPPWARQDGPAPTGSHGEPGPAGGGTAHGGPPREPDPAGRPHRRVAEFRWQPGQAVSLTVLDPEWGALAQDFYDNGVPVGAGRVSPEAGPEFMRALLQRFRMSYYKFVDESG